MIRATLAFVAAALVAAVALSGVETSRWGVGEQQHFARRLQADFEFEGCGGGESDWVSEYDVDISGNTFTFTLGGNERAEMKREDNRRPPEVYDETLRYTGAITGMERDTGVIIFQYHRDGDGSPPTAVKVYYDNRFRDDSTFDIYVRCNDGDGETEKMIIDSGYTNGDSFTLEMRKDTGGIVTVSVSGNSRTCSIAGYGDDIYPKFGLFEQDESSGSYADVAAVYEVEEYSCT